MIRQGLYLFEGGYKISGKSWLSLLPPKTITDVTFTSFAVHYRSGLSREALGCERVLELNFISCPRQKIPL